MTLLDFENGVREVSGDGGFETTTFSGFDNFELQPPPGVELQLQFAVVVNTTGDASDTSAGDGVCETAPGNNLCTLRCSNS